MNRIKIKLMENEEINKILKKEVEDKIDKPFITPSFGDDWKEYAKNNFDFSFAIDVAWRQGRKAILLERLLRDLLRERSSR